MWYSFQARNKHKLDINIKAGTSEATEISKRSIQGKGSLGKGKLSIFTRNGKKYAKK